MPFSKGNKLWKKSAKARRENRDRMQDFLAFIANGAISAYADAIDKLYEGKELSKPVLEAMDRTEKWKEYIAARKAPVDEKGETVKPVMFLPAELMEKNDIKSKE